MANSNQGGIAQHLTSIIVALIGAFSAIGGAWIMTQGQSAQPAPAAQVSNMAAPGDVAQPQAGASAAPAASSASSANPPMVIRSAPVADVAPEPLADSTVLDYGQPWPNQQGASQLIVERLEVARERVRVYLRFDNPSSSSITFYTAPDTSASTQGIQTYIAERKGTPQGVVASGGSLFADPRAVEIPGGAQLRGWLEYATGKGKKDSLSLYFISQTTGYPGAGTHRIEYEPLAIPSSK